MQGGNRFFKKALAGPSAPLINPALKLGWVNPGQGCPGAATSRASPGRACTGLGSGR
ncbi:protein of unknown function [Methylocaldum szegediense]|uniref:Uncharacterized protein n=1 Tax=Methylocaldum szegediense TaxID=73780 RepID=A0ABM9I7P3_9GAMM|nr:protein of unknown function [Methylocaldum szegediense]